MSDLEAILEGTTDTAETDVVTETEQTPEPEQPEQQPVEADDKGEEEQSQEADASEQSPDEGGSPTPEELAAEIDGLKKALKAERSRRQAAETEKKEKQPAPDVFESQEAFVQHMEAQMQEVGFNERANLSEFMARREFPDMDDRLEKFKELQEADPSLGQRVLNAVSPYHEIADIVEKAARLEKLENVDEVEAQLRAEIEAKVREEYEAKAQKEAELREKLPPSLSGTGTKSGIKGHDFSGPTPLTHLIPD